MAVNNMVMGRRRIMNFRKAGPLEDTKYGG